MQTEREISQRPAPGVVLDIGGSNAQILQEMAEEGLMPKDGHQQLTIPSAMMGDDVGLSLWTAVTYAPEYYQTRDEIDLLTVHGKEIAQRVPEHCTLIDLGSGSVSCLVSTK